MDEWFTPDSDGQTAVAQADDGLGFIPDEQAQPVDASRAEKAAGLRAELKQAQEQGPDFPWYAPGFMQDYDPAKPLVSLGPENVKGALYGPLRPTIWAAEKLGLIPSTAKTIKENVESSVAEGLSSFTAPETFPLLPAAAIPYVGPAMGLYFGTQATSSGAGLAVAGLEQEDPALVGQGIGSMAIGAGLLAGGGAGAKQDLTPEAAAKVSVAPRTAQVEVMAKGALKQASEPAAEAKPVEAKAAESAAPKVEEVAAKQPEPPVLEKLQVEPVAEAAKEPAAQLEPNPVPEGMKRRKFIERCKAAEDIQLETRKAVGNEFYEPRSPKEPNEFVNAEIEAGGITQFIRKLESKDNGLTPQEWVVGAANVQKRLNRQASDLDAAGKTEQANTIRDIILDITEAKASYGTALGRGVQAFRVFSAMSADGIIGSYRRLVTRTVEHTLRKKKMDRELNKISDFVRSEEFKNAEPDVKKKMLHDAFKNAVKAGRILQKNLLTLLDAARNPNVFDAELIGVIAEALKLPRIDEVFAKYLLKKAAEAEKLPEGFQRDSTMSDILTDIRKKIGIPMREVANAWWYASILSGPMTQAVNVGAGMLKAGSDLALLGAVNRPAVPQMLDGMIRGLTEGAFEAAAIISKGDYSRKEGNIYSPSTLEALKNEPNYLLKTLALGRFVGRAMAAADMLNYKMAEQGFSHLEAFQKAKGEGLKGAEREARVKELLNLTKQDLAKFKEQAKSENLSRLDTQRRFFELIEQSRDKHITSNARDFGLEATLNQTPVGHVGYIVDWITQLTINEPVMRAVVPFARIVGNAFNEQLNWTQLGWFRAKNGYGGPRPQEISNPNQRALVIAKATIGTALMMGLYKAIVASQDENGDSYIDLSAKGPESADARKALRETNWRPYTIKVGDKYYNYLNTPYAIPLALTGYFRDAEKYQKMDRKTMLERLAFSSIYSLTTILSMQFLSGFNRFVGGLSGKPGSVNEIVGVASNAAKGFVLPNIVKWLDQVWDPELKDAQTLNAQLIRDIPVVRSMMLKPALNALGEEIRKEGTDRFALDRFWTTSKSDPAWNLFAEKKAFPSLPQKDTMLNNEPMTEEQFYEFTKLRGKYMRELIDMRLLDIIPMNREEFKDELEHIQTTASKQAKADMLNK